MDQITLPEVPEDDWANRPIYERFTDPINWGVEETKLREAKRGYYAGISFMDAQIGKLLKRWKKKVLQTRLLSYSVVTTAIIWDSMVCGRNRPCLNTLPVRR